jgi:Histidine kinase-, DNA gyrase B-, and HSP90-like ATPase
MTRWSLRRLLGGTRDAEREHWPVPAARVAGRPSTAQPPATAGPLALAQPAEPVSATAREAAARPGLTETTEPGPGGAWPDICDQFGLQLLVLAEQLRTSLDELEADEGDPERLRRLYQVDHAVTRMRRASRDLRTLAGRSEEELAGFTTSLLDVIRMAASAIERYTQVTIGRVTDLAVLGYAADDIGSVMAVLLDNATRYSPGTVTVSGHLLDDGSVMFRVEDTGIGIGADQVTALNAALAGPVPDVDERTGRHTGFPVVHRIARKHSVGVRLASRPLPSSGTVAMVMLPPHLLCEVPAEEAQRRPAPAPATGSPAPPAPRPSVVPDLRRGEPTRPHKQQRWEPLELPDRDQPRPAGGLPRRERASLRGDQPRPRSQEPAMVPTPEQQAAARRAFADELSAFSLGAVGSPDSAEDTATEEEARP